VPWLRICLQMAGSLILSVVLLAAPGHASAKTIRVTLDGRPSTIRQATAFHCHDLIISLLQCFRSQAERNRAVDNILGSPAAHSSEQEPGGAESTGYVIAYAAISYGGSSVVLSKNYANLGTIGWTNIISSYKVFTNLTGAFYQNTSYGGGTQLYCCFTDVAYVGDLFNDTFSSFLLP
jgi:hypothetical protein